MQMSRAGVTDVMPVGNT